MTNHHIKLEDPRAMSSLVIDQPKFGYRPTNGLIYWLACAKQYTPTYSKGDIITNTGNPYPLSLPYWNWKLFVLAIQAN